MMKQDYIVNGKDFGTAAYSPRMAVNKVLVSKDIGNTLPLHIEVTLKILSDNSQEERK